MWSKNPEIPLKTLLLKALFISHIQARKVLETIQSTAADGILPYQVLFETRPT